ncbi:C1 family peptidase [Pseudostreptobacillus hongkongensis]|uniref:aminopeptidase C n=1 Tax=Pseudostreptobacillus hongkongensis TaxID=1162717 RepID=UPI0028D81DAC|nr:C1 family peptidase [Pseudostreptobacillus hongkongensis]
MKNTDMTKEKIVKMKENYEGRNLRVLQNAVLKNGINNAVVNNEVYNRTHHVFSENIETGKVTYQKQSGRCWIFAALNTFRHKMNKEYNLENFELSQSYVFFWDKFEKSNYFLDNIIKTRNEEIDSRIVRHLLQTPQQDGGQWDMLVSVIKKYGVVPKSVQGEVFHSSSSVMLNNLLNKKLRLGAQKLREANNMSEDQLIELKDEIMDEIYAFLCVMLGAPQEVVDFEYYDKDKKFHRDLGLTPVEFFNKYVNMNLDDYISIINAPTDDKPYYRTFTVDFLGNVTGNEVKYLNLPMDEFKNLAIEQIKQGETVWFGCDVGQISDRLGGMMDLDVFEYEQSFGFDILQDKKNSLDYSESLMTHAMVLSGVNLDENGKSNRWKVENSWGEEPGNKGYFVMSDAWMDRFTYQIVVNKKYLTERQKEALKQDPIRLKPWDPMGSLAK